MELGLRGKTVAITGGTGGIGYAMARAFAREGANIAICDITEEALKYTREEIAKEGLNWLCERADVTDEGQLQTFCAHIQEHFGGLDVWCNNAGIVSRAPILEADAVNDWDRVINVNLNGVFRGTQVAGRVMAASGKGGVILNTASVNALLPTCNKASYAASKAAVVSLTKATAAELAPSGVRCVAIMPAMTLAPERVGMATGPGSPAMRERMKNPKAKVLLDNLPLRRLAEAEEVADFVVFLASERASFVTGEAYAISGGLLCVQDPMTAWGEGWTGIV